MFGPWYYSVKLCPFGLWFNKNFSEKKIIYIVFPPFVNALTVWYAVGDCNIKAAHNR